MVVLSLSKLHPETRLGFRAQPAWMGSAALGYRGAFPLLKSSGGRPGTLTAQSHFHGTLVGLHYPALVSSQRNKRALLGAWRRKSHARPARISRTIVGAGHRQPRIESSVAYGACQEKSPDDETVDHVRNMSYLAGEASCQA
jgi:hypothetical protein